MKKRVFLQAYYHCNLGDDLFIKIICERYPDAEFLLVAPNNKKNKLDGLENLTVIRRNTFFKIKSKLLKLFTNHSFEMNLASKCDCTVLLGGSMFIELDGKWKNILENYKRVRKCSNKYFIIGSNFGPYTSKEFIKEYRSFFTNVDSICFRDKWSYDLFSDIKQTVYAPDIVFNLSMIKKKKNKEITIAPILIDNRKEFGNCEGYYIAIAGLCNEAVEAGYTVNLLSFCIEQHDDLACQKIFYLMNECLRKSVHHFNYTGNINNALNIISRSEAVVAIRFHAMILGFITHSKVCPIIYSNKTENVLKDIDFKGSINRIETLSELKLETILDENNVCNIDSMTKNAAKQFTIFDEFMKK